MSTPEVQNDGVWDIFFGDSDSDSDFEGFTTEEITEQQLRTEIAREAYQRENGSDIDPTELAERLLEDLHADDIDVADLQWSENSDDVTLFNFNGDESGPFHDLGCTGDQLDFFRLFMTDDFLDHLVRETNKYAQFKQDRLQKVDADWSPVDRNEMKAYFGVIILMGIHSLPEIRDFWSTDDRLHVPGVAKVMSRNKFMKLNQYLHVNDPYAEPDRQDPGRDRLYKVRPIIDVVRSKFPMKFMPFREISIDEAMCKFSGRSPMIQYMPAKPVK
ncbi:piggyBac transposable element-derived protein 4-like [Ptychodera flava]|uniref:piggyBac transposable element-derived protein 4-like n=1 Tax=Ptychodera flava TaxID=63121 RepID=UPI00396A54B7